jgi:hypothetical protein
VRRQTKGAICTQLKTFTVRRFGDDAWARVLARLSPEDRDVVTSALAMGWYDTQPCLRALEAFDEELGARDAALLTEYGRWAAESDLTVFHRAFLRLANPAFVMEKFGDYWGRYHTHGTWSVERRPHGLAATLTGFEGSPVYCKALTPYVQRVLELVGAQDVRSTHPRCASRGHEAWVWAVVWR